MRSRRFRGRPARPTTCRRTWTPGCGRPSSQALGQGYNLYTNRIDEQWFKPLADAAICFARHPSAASRGRRRSWTNTTSSNRTSAAGSARRPCACCSDEIGKLPVEQLQRLIIGFRPNDPAVEKEAWQKIAAGPARPLGRRARLAGQELSSAACWPVFCKAMPSAEPWLDFLRTQLQGAPDEYRAGMRGQLFDALLGQPWKQAYEDEAFGLLAQLPAAEQRPSRAAGDARSPPFAR